MTWQGKDKLLHFEITIRPDEGTYKCALAPVCLPFYAWRRLFFEASNTNTTQLYEPDVPAQGGRVHFFLQHLDIVPTRCP